MAAVGTRGGAAIDGPATAPATASVKAPVKGPNMGPNKGPVKGPVVALVAAVVAALAAGLTACGIRPDTVEAAAPVVVRTTPPDSPYRGTVLPDPRPLPALVLRDQHGDRYDLRARVDGRLTLFFVGYTHCPDICPTTMADLAQVRRQLTPAEREQVRVVFVTSDPERDTPRRLARWLGAFDPAIVGLTGDFRTIQRAVRTVGIAISAPRTLADGTVVVQHSSQVLLFDAAGTGRLAFTSGFAVPDVVHDVRRMLRADPARGGPARAGTEPSAHRSTAGAPGRAAVSVVDAWVREPVAGDRSAAAYATIVGGTRDDRLLAVDTPAAASARLHRVVDHGAVESMRPASGLDVPGGGRAVLRPGGYHVMLTGLDQRLRPGDRLALVFSFARAGEVRVQATVRGYAGRHGGRDLPGGDAAHGSHGADGQ